MNIEKKITKLKNQSCIIKAAGGKEYPVTKEGSLGLLALGYRGILAWKKKMLESEEKKNED